MRPVLSPRQMRVIDAEAATLGTPLEVLVARAGAAVARTARRMLGGLYGRTVVVVIGKGNNGADGRVTARLLANEGVRVHVLDAANMPARLPTCDLIIDAAYGTGFRGHWAPPPTRGIPVLAVDIPSGVDGLTGLAVPGAWRATRTVTFVALKPGQLLGRGPALCGDVELVDIGIRVARTSIDVHEVESSDVAQWVPRREWDAHKWHHSLFALAGSAGMLGAASLCTAAAMRAGAGIVHVASPGISSDRGTPTEVVRRSLPMLGWSTEVLSDLERFNAVVVGPGLGRDEGTIHEARRIISTSHLPMVIDGDGLFAVAWGGEGARDIVRSRAAGTILTPHDGEYTTLLGTPPTPDRISSVRRLAVDTNCVVLLKGSTTVVGEPSGQVLVVANGDERLATAGSGDVLTGIIGALLTRGVPPFHAAAAGAWLHARAGAAFGASEGLIASDLVDLIPTAFESVREVSL